MSIPIHSARRSQGVVMIYRLFVLFCVVFATASAGRSQDSQDFSRWEKAIAAFEKQDREQPPAKEGIVLLGSDGKPRPELFLKDQLHLNAEGYALWNKVVMPYLAERK